jgi:hypothetical protein
LPAYTRSGNVITGTGLVNLNTAGIDGITNLVVGDRVLLVDGVSGLDNGLYTITTLGATGTTNYVLTRTTDADTSAKLMAGSTTIIEEGTANADSWWILTTNNTITINVTALTFTKFSSGGGIAPGLLASYLGW